MSDTLELLQQFHRYELHSPELRERYDTMAETLVRLTNGTNEEHDRAGEIINHICERAVRVVAAGKTASEAMRGSDAPGEHSALAYECLAFCRFTLSGGW